MKTRALITAIALTSCAVFAQGNAGWTVPDADQSWGGNNETQRMAKEGRDNTDQGAKALSKTIPATPVANPFDANGVYIGESQALTNTGVDPSTGVTVTDTPVIPTK